MNHTVSMEYYLKFSNEPKGKTGMAVLQDLNFTVNNISKLLKYRNFYKNLWTQFLS